MKAIPRPWTAVEDSDSEDGWYVIAADKTVITLNVTKAEARLIAAVPSMLEVLKCFMDLSEGVWFPTPAHARAWKKCVDTARAAIARAEGAS